MTNVMRMEGRFMKASCIDLWSLKTILMLVVIR
jgi:hypothetical protein